MVQGKLTRKEIVRQDMIRKTLTAISVWLLRNRTYILVAIAGFIIIVAAFYLIQQFLSSQAEEMQAEFSDALAVYHAPVDSGEDNAQDPVQQLPTKYRFSSDQKRQETALDRFRELAQKYEGKKIGYLASYYAGLCLLDLERESEAKEMFELVNRNSSNSDVRSLARNSLAQLAVEASDYEEAVQLYRQLLEESSQVVPKQIVLLRLGQLLERTGRLEEALEVFRQVTSEYVGTSSASQAQEMIRKIEPRVRPADVEESSEPLEEENQSES